MFKTFILCSLLLTSSGLGEEPPAYRELRCRVVDERGRAVPGQRVYLCGLDRGTPSPEEIMDPAESHSGWIFTTDKQGGFTVPFRKPSPHGHEPSETYEGPGYGYFQLVATRSGWAGAISRMIVNVADAGSFVPPSSEPPPDGEDREEWRRGEFAPLVLGDQPVSGPLDIVLKRGVEIRGRMVDTQGRPVRGRGIEWSQDLHYGSHTGAGGEIFGRSTPTDRAGRFHFSHVYPNRFQIRPTWEGQPVYWTGTRVRRSWADEAVDEITPRSGGEQHPEEYERVIAVRLVVERRRTYRYFGRITDEQGRVVPGMSVHIQTSSRQRPPGLYGDGQASEDVRTDAQGCYSIRVGIPDVDFIYTSGKNREGGAGTPNVPIPPGRYDFTVHPKRSGE